MVITHGSQKTAVRYYVYMIRVFKNVSLFAVLVSVAGWGLLFVVIGTAQESVTRVPVLQVTTGMLSEISAQSVYVFDLDSGTALFARAEDSVLPIASVTKLLSSALFYEYASSSEVTTITWSDIDTEGRSGRLEAQQQYQNKELLFPALLESSNDATTVMQRVLQGTLVEKMNTYALGTQLTQTRFTDTSGLDNGNVSTAYELSLLSTALYKEYPYIFDITRLKTYLNHINAWMNSNPFVYEDAYRGGKHGYTYAANRTVIAFFDEELQSGQVRTIGYVLLGSETLQTDVERLRSYVQTSVAYE